MLNSRVRGAIAPLVVLLSVSCGDDPEAPDMGSLDMGTPTLDMTTQEDMGQAMPDMGMDAPDQGAPDMGEVGPEFPDTLAGAQLRWLFESAQEGRVIDVAEYEAHIEDDLRSQVPLTAFNGFFQNWSTNLAPGTVLEFELDLPESAVMLVADRNEVRSRWSVSVAPAPDGRISGLGVDVAFDKNPALQTPLGAREIAISGFDPNQGGRLNDDFDVLLLDPQSGAPFEPAVGARADAYGFAKLTLPQGAEWAALRFTRDDGFVTDVYDPNHTGGVHIIQPVFPASALPFYLNNLNLTADPQAGHLWVQLRHFSNDSELDFPIRTSIPLATVTATPAIDLLYSDDSTLASTTATVTSFVNSTLWGFNAISEPGAGGYLVSADSQSEVVTGVVPRLEPGALTVLTIDYSAPEYPRNPTNGHYQDMSSIDCAQREMLSPTSINSPASPARLANNSSSETYRVLALATNGVEVPLPPLFPMTELDFQLFVGLQVIVTDMEDNCISIGEVGASPSILQVP